MLRGSVATAVALTLRPGFAGIAGVLPGGAQSAAANATWFGAVLPTLPNQFTTTSAPPAPANTNRGSYYTPGVGGDASLTLQQAIDDAAAATGSLGDVIVVQAGTTYSTAGTLTIPARSGSGWVYVISSDAPELGGSGLPAAGTRVGPSNVANMGSIRNSASSTGGNVVVFSAQAAVRRCREIWTPKTTNKLAVYLKKAACSSPTISARRSLPWRRRCSCRAPGRSTGATSGRRSGARYGTH